MFEAECREEDAPRFADWIANRGGIAVWSSVNLANPLGSWSAPVRDKDGNVNGKPSWQASDTPKIVTDASKVGVYREVVYERIPVCLRRGSQGFMLKLTDASERKLDAALDNCMKEHGSAHFRKGGLENPEMIIYYEGGAAVPLSEWKAVAA